MKQAWLVDDDEEMAAAVSLMIKVLGYSPRSFLAAPDAGRALLSGERPDLILLDLNMPQVSGKDFLEFVRSRAEFDQLPIVMLSSEFSDKHVNELLDIGADAYVSKPVSIEELESAIGKAVNKRAKA
ncbi:MAG: response regulator [Anaerolineales bacterium]